MAELSERNVVDALLAAAPALNPSHGARSRMRRRLLGALHLGADDYARQLIVRARRAPVDRTG